MRLFYYQASDDSGRLQQGQHWAANRAGVREWLLQQGLRCQKCRPAQAWYQGITPSQKRDIGQQLASLIRSGLPLTEALGLLAQGRSGIGASALAHIKMQVEAGAYLAVALRAHPTLFDPLFCNLVAVGEQSGTLDSMLQRAVLYQEKALALRRSLQNALAYPFFILGLAALLSLFLLLGVLPQFATLFAKFEAPLPPLTAGLLGLAETLGTHGKVISALCLSFVLGLQQCYQRSAPFRAYSARLGLRLPLWGAFFQKVILARFSSTLALTLKAGIPLLEALPLVAEALGSSLYRLALQQAAGALRQGVPLHQALAPSQLFPPMLLQWIATGEAAGSLDSLLATVAQHYEEELNQTLQNLHRLLEPCIMVILGGVVGTLVIAMYWPIFTMGTVF